MPIPGESATIEVARRKEDQTLWIYLVDGVDGKRVPVREVTWAFADEEAVECWVGVYAARPAKESELGKLEVRFSQLEVELA